MSEIKPRFWMFDDGEYGVELYKERSQPDMEPLYDESALAQARAEMKERCERLEGFISKQEQDFRDRHKAQSRMRKAARASGDRDAEKFHEGAQCMALQAAEQLCWATFSGTEPDEMTRERDVFELRLCEQSHLILKPNQLYRFTVDKTCEACRAIAAEYAE